MGKWKVINVHQDKLTHVEKFKDVEYRIPFGEFVEMDYEDAVQFKGQYFPMKLNAMNVQDPSSYKMIKIEPVDAVSEAESVSAKQVFVSHIDGKEFPTKQLLEAYLATHFSDSELIVKDETLDKELAKNKRK